MTTLFITILPAPCQMLVSQIALKQPIDKTKIIPYVFTVCQCLIGRWARPHLFEVWFKAGLFHAGVGAGVDQDW